LFCYSPQRLLPRRLATRYNCDSKIDRATAASTCTYTWHCQNTAHTHSCHLEKHNTPRV